MSALALPKLYGDMTLLFKSDFDAMWDALEEKTNGGIDSDNVATGWAHWGQVTLDNDQDFVLGEDGTGFVRFYSDTSQFIFAHDTTARNTYFKIGGTIVGTIDSSANLSFTKDIYFYNRNTDYPLSFLIGYQKPVLVYSDSTTINMEQNIATASTSLVVFPAGPIAVTEDISSTHKFRQLKISATANGYGLTHTGAADSGMKVGVSLTANAWYFVYACIIRGGDDSGFVMVADSTSPVPANWSTLDSSYGSGCWVYLGMFRYGHGTAQTTTMVPFLQDHQGWHSFTGRAAANDLFGICTHDGTISGTSYTTVETYSAASTGDAAPANCSMLKIATRMSTSGGGMCGHVCVQDSADTVLWDLNSFGENLDLGEAHGISAKIPNGQGLKLKARRGSLSNDDYTLEAYISAVLDEWA